MTRKAGRPRKADSQPQQRTGNRNVGLAVSKRIAQIAASDPTFTLSKLATAVGLDQKTLNLYLQGHRGLEVGRAVDIAVQLNVNHQPESEFIKSFLSDCGFAVRSRNTRDDRIVSRILEEEVIIAGYIVNEPFVLAPKNSDAPIGPAIEVFELMAQLMGVGVQWRPLSFDNLTPPLYRGDVDIVVTYGFRSFNRVLRTRAINWTSGLKIGLNALAPVQSAMEAPHPKQIRVLPKYNMPIYVVKGALSEIYCRTLLSGDGSDSLIRAEPLAPADLLRHALKRRAIGVTDSPVCDRILREVDEGRLEGVKPGSVKKLFPDQLHSQEGGFILTNDDASWAEALDTVFRLLTTTYVELYLDIFDKYEATLRENLGRDTFDPWRSSLDSKFKLRE